MLQRSARFVFPTHSRTDIKQMVFTMWFPYTQFESMTEALADGSNVLRSKEEPLEPFLQPGGLLSSPPFASTFPRPPLSASVLVICWLFTLASFLPLSAAVA